jgi:transcription antitermination factor NusG
MHGCTAEIPQIAAPDGAPWFAVQTRPRWERLVHDALRGKGYDAYLPLYSVRRRWADRIKTIEQPLFSGYCFCRLNLSARYLPVLTTPGVRQLVGVAGAPQPIPDHEIESVRTIVASGLGAQPWPFLKVGDRVRLRGGSLDGLEGILLATRKRYRLVVSVELLQRSVAVEVDQSWVEAVASRSSGKRP